MHSLRNSSATAWVWLTALLTILAPALPPKALQAQEAPADLAALLARFRSLSGLSARFREEKHIALLEEPLISEGVLYFAPPARLARIVERPSPSSMVLDGNDLRLTDARRTEHIDLSQMPLVRSLVDAFRTVLAGDDAALARSFRTRLRHETDGGWTLGLSPRLRAVARAIHWVEVSGRDVHISRLRIFEASGDESLTVFSDVDTARTFGAAEAQRIFGPGPATTGARSR